MKRNTTDNYFVPNDICKQQSEIIGTTKWSIFSTSGIEKFPDLVLLNDLDLLVWGGYD